jgi:hypothetical protein
MATQGDLTTLASLFKILYPEASVIKNLSYYKNPFYAMVKKNTGFVGSSYDQPVIMSNSQNRSAASIPGINTTAIMKNFLLTRVSNYATAAISNEAYKASARDDGAFLRVAKLSVDSALRELGNSIATQLFRSGTGTVAQISSSATLNSTSVYVQLQIPGDIVNLQVGMQVAFSSSDGGAVESGTAYIVSIDRVNGGFLCSATFGGSVAALNSLVSTVAASDYIYQIAADRNAVISGLGAWIPTAVTSTAFFGVDRTSDSRLHGLYYDGSASIIEDALIDASTLLAREGASPDVIFMSFADFAKLSKAKMSNVIYTDVNVEEADLHLSFSGIVQNLPSGAAKVIPDRSCPVGTAYILQIDTWTLHSLGEPVELFTGDGLDMIRDASADNMNIRCTSYAQLGCSAPGWNCRVKLPA